MLGYLRERLKQTPSLKEKRSVLASLPDVEAFFSSNSNYQNLIEKLSLKRQLVFYQLIAIGQADTIFEGFDFDESRLIAFLDQLVPIDHFYREIGGLIGYQAKIIELLKQKEDQETSNSEFHPPSFIDIAEESPFVQDAIEWGLETLQEVAEIYPLGGAADRLHLLEEKSGVELPAAKLPFLGKTLLEILIRDLEAREHLYFKKTGRQITTPIAIMTSQEKNNHKHVLEICEENRFFGRPRDSIRFFTQPLVPAVEESGAWCVRGPLNPVLKPGGHGAIWKLARDEGVFDWLKAMGRTKALVRQINNPIAGLDYGLLAFTGIGCKEKMVFGFASCARLLKAAEGVNVLVERDQKLVLTNIEYCDFDKYGIQDRPLKPKEPYSKFSSNTNILFADLEAVSSAVDACPFPGLLINLKKSSYQTEQGKKKEAKMARLESTMQNIADVFTEEKGEELRTKKTFVTYNWRHKTISTAKKAFCAGKPLKETPENCLYDLLTANRELLERLKISLPQKRSVEEYLKMGPEFSFLYNPSLGPLYSEIEKKIQGGSIEEGSEVLLDIADLKANNLRVQGSLQIIAEQPVGHFDAEGKLIFSSNVGSCELENVTIENRGVDWSQSEPFWKMRLFRKETVKIILKGKSKFVARNLHLQGSHTFVVEDGKMMKIL